MKHGRHEIPIPSWVDHEMQNWARWSLSAEYPGRPDWPGPRMARDLISRFYRAPDWGDDVRPLPPNEAHAQGVEQVVQKRMQPLERRIVDAEYLHPWDSGRGSYGRTGVGSMKYAQEIIDLMGAYPGRDFRMREIVRYVAGNHPSYEERRRVRAQIANVIRELEAMGCLSRHMPASQRGRYTLYRWCS